MTAIIWKDGTITYENKKGQIVTKEITHNQLFREGKIVDAYLLFKRHSTAENLHINSFQEYVYSMIKFNN